MVSFNALGTIGIITGINSDGIFVGNLYSEIYAPYSAVGKRPVMLDIREALETSSTVDEAGAFLGDPSRVYAYHNNMFIADKNTAKVLENDYERNRALRRFDSELNEGVTWNVPDAIACVNAFVLKGNFDNFTKDKGNTLRWASFEALLKEGDTVNLDQVRRIMSYQEGFIYNQGTITSMAYSYAENRMELWFGTYVEDPQYETISIPFLENQ
ncbi:MAG: C45 family peptidase [Deltaproteobacteria bacterium]|nr:C45 family peptidase [Deltaproteobacteria bacterium]